MGGLGRVDSMLSHVWCGSVLSRARMFGEGKVSFNAFLYISAQFSLRFFITSQNDFANIELNPEKLRWQAQRSRLYQSVHLYILHAVLELYQHRTSL